MLDQLFRMAVMLSEVLSYSLLTDNKPLWNWGEFPAVSIHHLNSPKQCDFNNSPSRPAKWRRNGVWAETGRGLSEVLDESTSEPSSVCRVSLDSLVLPQC